MSELTQIQADIKQCKEVIEFAVVVEELQKGENYKKVFEVDYFDKELKRLVRALAKTNPESRKEINARILGISFCMEQLEAPARFAEIAKQQLEELAEAEAEVIVEGL